jgi:penicillin-binding protein 1C
VWLGNFDNRPSVDLVGSEAAGPLLFDLLEAVDDRSRLALPDGPTEDLRPVEVCTYSGHLPSTACESTQTVLALTRRVPTKVCPYHVALDIDRITGLALNPSCRSGRDFETRSFLVWPATIRRWLGRRYRWLPSPPALAEECKVVDRHEPPSILSPPRGQVMALLPGVPESEQEVPLMAESSGKRLSWFVDGEFLGSVDAEERLWWKPTPGRHEFLVMDESGRSARRSLRVRQGM